MSESARGRNPGLLDRAECMNLLRSVGLGRAAWTEEDGRVVVEPVNFAVASDMVAFGTAAGSKLDAARRRAPFSFEVDDVEPALRTGWSVLVHGTPEIVTDPVEIERLAPNLQPPWDESAPKPYLVLLAIEEVSGRRLPLSPGGVTWSG